MKAWGGTGASEEIATSRKGMARRDGERMDSYVGEDDDTKRRGRKGKEHWLLFQDGTGGS